jgi:hypothetical protein
MLFWNGIKSVSDQAKKEDYRIVGANCTKPTYIDAPEFLNRVESDDLLEQVIPVVTLESSWSVLEVLIESSMEG